MNYENDRRRGRRMKDEKKELEWVSYEKRLVETRRGGGMAAFVKALSL